ncbi:unnamed protein product [Soboliphyme baturini]|uniref:Nephrin n=1 Tax=Soboliphyme baturini TaxID=241478 RepID=A0A183IBB0_9BILA|nr:unnamed protein product [Soboliphyme baturini]
MSNTILNLLPLPASFGCRRQDSDVADMIIILLTLTRWGGCCQHRHLAELCGGGTSADPRRHWHEPSRLLPCWHAPRQATETTATDRRSVTFQARGWRPHQLLVGRLLRGSTWLIAQTGPAHASLFFFRNFHVVPANKTVVEGEDFVIPCVISDQFLLGNTYWTKGGMPLGFEYSLPGYERYSVVGNHAVGEYTLKVIDAKIEDEADYECQVLPEPGDEEGLRGVAFVTVLVPPKSVKLPNIDNGGKLSAHSGSTIEIVCQTDGSNPEAEIRWYRNSDVIAAAKTWKKKLENSLVSTISQIRWPVAKSDDGSMFICQASHPAFQTGQFIRTNVTLSAIWKDMKKLVRQNIPQVVWTAKIPPSALKIQGYDGRTLKAGERIHLQCVVNNGNPLPEVLWYRNSKLIDRTYITNPVTSVNDYEFAVDASDNVAEYKCQSSNAATFAPLSEVVRLKILLKAWNYLVRIQLKAVISLSSPATPVRLIRRQKFHGSLMADPLPALHSSSDLLLKMKACIRPEQVTIYGYEHTPMVAGTTHRLSCVAIGGNPLATINWYKNGRQLTRGVTNTVSDNVAQAELTFAVGPEDNMAEFSCNAENSATVKPLVAKLNATVFCKSYSVYLVGPETVVIKSKASEFRVGESAQLTCETGSSNPAPVVSWWRNGDQLNGVYVHNKSSNFYGWEVKSKLIIPVTSNEDGMKYICRATNPALNRSINEAIFVHVKYITSSKLKCPPLHGDAPQFFWTGLQSITVLENESVILNASAKANPMPISYEWTKSIGSFSSRSARPSAGSGIDGPFMNFTRISRRDAGEFKCKATNAEGSSILTFHVQVKCNASILCC